MRQGGEAMRGTPKNALRFLGTPTRPYEEGETVRAASSAARDIASTGRDDYVVSVNGEECTGSACHSCSELESAKADRKRFSWSGSSRGCRWRLRPARRLPRSGSAGRAASCAPLPWVCSPWDLCWASTASQSSTASSALSRLLA